MSCGATCARYICKLWSLHSSVPRHRHTPLEVSVICELLLRRYSEYSAVTSCDTQLCVVIYCTCCTISRHIFKYEMMLILVNILWDWNAHTVLTNLLYKPELASCSLNYPLPLVSYFCILLKPKLFISYLPQSYPVILRLKCNTKMPSKHRKKTARQKKTVCRKCCKLQTACKGQLPTECWTS